MCGVSCYDSIKGNYSVTLKKVLKKSKSVQNILTMKISIDILKYV